MQITPMKRLTISRIMCRLVIISVRKTVENQPSSRELRDTRIAIQIDVTNSNFAANGNIRVNLHSTIWNTCKAIAELRETFENRFIAINCMFDVRVCTWMQCNHISYSNISLLLLLILADANYQHSTSTLRCGRKLMSGKKTKKSDWTFILVTMCASRLVPLPPNVTTKDSIILCIRPTK